MYRTRNALSAPETHIPWEISNAHVRQVSTSKCSDIALTLFMISDLYKCPDGLICLKCIYREKSQRCSHEARRTNTQTRLPRNATRDVTRYVPTRSCTDEPTHVTLYAPTLKKCTDACAYYYCLLSEQWLRNSYLNTFLLTSSVILICEKCFKDQVTGVAASYSASLPVFYHFGWVRAVSSFHCYTIH